MTLVGWHFLKGLTSHAVIHVQSLHLHSVLSTDVFFCGLSLELENHPQFVSEENSDVL